MIANGWVCQRVRQVLTGSGICERAKIAARPDECREYALANSSSLLSPSVMDPQVVVWAESDLTMGYEVSDLCCSASIQRWELDRRPRGVSSASGMWK